MAGNQTNGFDLALEFSENFFNQFLGTMLDSPTDGNSTSLLCQLVTALGQPALCGAFTINILMSRPTDITLPAGATDFFDIQISVGGSAMFIRMVVGIVTNRTNPNADVFYLEFTKKLFAQQVKIAGIPLPNSVARSAIQSVFTKVPLPSIPLNGGRMSTDPKNIIRADTHVIDDASAAALNAWAILLTFGGGVPGNIGGFTQSFIPTGGTGGIAAFFNWILRIISPALANALGMDPSNIVNGHLVNPAVVDSDNDITLTNLDITLINGFIQISSTVTQSGFCYDATGNLTARLKLAVEQDSSGNSHIVIQAEMDDPDISVDMPWYCWIAGAVIGALLGGVLFGVIGAIVGAVLVPLLTWIAEEVINGIIDDITSVVGDAINAVLPDVDISVPGLNFFITDAFIDDILIKATVNVRDVSPIKCSGSVILNNGQYLDLDTGTVQNDDTSGADIYSGGSGFGRYLKTVCRASLARTWQKELANLARFNCYGYAYQYDIAIPLSELAEFDVWGMLWGDKYDEEEYVYAVVTNENRYSLFRVTEVQDTWMRVDYKTFGVAQSLSLVGGFTCGPNWKLTENPIVFTPSPVLLQNAAQLNAAVLQAQTLQSADASPVSITSTAASARLATARAASPVVAAPANNKNRVVGISGASLNANVGPLGTWMGQYNGTKNDTGLFVAQAQGLVSPITYFWAINGNALTGDSGTVTVDGKTMNWSLAANRLTLTPIDHLTFEFELKVTAVDVRGTPFTKIKCVKYVPVCKVTKRTLPPFKLYRTHYSQLWGLGAIPLKNLSSPPAPVILL